MKKRTKSLLEEINNRILLPNSLLKYILLDLCKDKKIKVDCDLYAKYDFSINLSKDNLLIKNKLLDILNKELFQTSSINDLANQLDQDNDTIKKLLQIEKSDNNIIIINNRCFIVSFLPLLYIFNPPLYYKGS